MTDLPVNRCSTPDGARGTGQRPLFLALKAKWFDAFASGEKRSELRLYGPRWNERTCFVGRDVVLSRGYGKASRLRGTIREFYRRKARTFGSTYQSVILETFGTLDKEIAEIRIDIAAREVSR